MIDELQEYCTQPFEISLTGVDRAQISYMLQGWFTNTPKRQVPDLETKAAEFKKRLTELALSIKLTFTHSGKGGELLATASGQAADTLNSVRLGTLWFDGTSTLEADIMAVIQD